VLPPLLNLLDQSVPAPDLLDQSVPAPVLVDVPVLIPVPPLLKFDLDPLILVGSVRVVAPLFFLLLLRVVSRVLTAPSTAELSFHLRLCPVMVPVPSLAASVAY